MQNSTKVLPKAEAGLKNRELCSSSKGTDFIWNRPYEKMLKIMKIFVVKSLKEADSSFILVETSEMANKLEVLTEKSRKTQQQSALLGLE